MLKFIWGKGHQPTAERLKLQKELFGFSKVSIVIYTNIKRQDTSYLSIHFIVT